MTLGSTLQVLTQTAHAQLFDRFLPSLHPTFPPNRAGYVGPWTNTQDPANPATKPWEDWLAALPTTAAQPWVNDPVGPVWDAKRQVWRAWMLSVAANNTKNAGPTLWAEFVSADLISWTYNRLPFDTRGQEDPTMWGGCCVIDHHNTAGYGAGAALYFVSQPGGSTPDGHKIAAQSIARWVGPELGLAPVYEGLVLPNPMPGEGSPVEAASMGFRDPRVFWDEAHHQWVMALTVDYGIAFYGSANTHNWTFLSVIDLHKWRQIECPNLVTMTDAHGTAKWVLFVSLKTVEGHYQQAVGYLVGEWDGTSFTPDQRHIQLLNQGHDYYAQSIFQKDGQTFAWAWMGEWTYSNLLPSSSFRGNQSMVTRLDLVPRDGGWVIMPSFLKGDQITQKQYYPRYDTSYNITLGPTGSPDAAPMTQWHPPIHYHPWGVVPS